jgi:hypothetical protein
MELPKHACVSCANLCIKADEFVGISIRNWITQKESFADSHYTYLVCYKGNLQRFYLSGLTKDDIRERVTNPKYSCKYLKQFINGVSPIASEQQESSKWGRRAFWAALTSVCVAILLFVISLVIDHFLTSP